MTYNNPTSPLSPETIAWGLFPSDKINAYGDYFSDWIAKAVKQIKAYTDQQTAGIHNKNVALKHQLHMESLRSTEKDKRIKELEKALEHSKCKCDIDEMAYYGTLYPKCERCSALYG